MAATTTAIATLQPVWDCRWSQPGHRLTGIADALQPETTWVCVHGGTRRNVCESECRTCPYFELGSDKIVGAAELGLRVARPAIPPGELIRLSLRGVLVMAAVLFIATGLVILNGPLAVPFTIALWLCAAVMVGLAVFAQFPGDES